MAYSLRSKSFVKLFQKVAAGGSLSLFPFLFLFFFPSPLPALPHESALTKWMVAGPFLAVSGDGGIDYLWRYGGAGVIVPSEGQTFVSPLADRGEVRWREVRAEGPRVKVNFPDVRWDALESRYGRAVTGFVAYAYSEIEVPVRTRCLVHLAQVPVFYLNGVRHGGEPYDYGFTKVPVVLEPGKNRILLVLSGKQSTAFYFSLLPAGADVVVLEDYTTPDIIEGRLLVDVPVGLTLANTTESTLKDLSIKVKENEYFRESVQGLPPLAALAIMKAPVFVSMKKAVPRSLQQYRLPVEVYEGDSLLYETAIPFAVKRQEEAHTRTFLSRMDGSAQYYAILYPAGYDPKKKYGAIFSLHGAGVAAEEHLAPVRPKDWAFVIGPTNRRPYGSDWQQTGRLDFEEVYGLVKREYPVDDERVYLTGASMGGQGVWHIGLHEPSRFAALAPHAGWTSYRLYTPDFFQRSQHFAPPDLLAIRDRVFMDSVNTYFIPNALNLPVLVNQGADDQVVPPLHPRIYVDLMTQQGYPVTYREVPGQGHSWTEQSDNATRYDCLDNREIVDFLKSRRLDPYPRKVTAKLFDLSINDVFYWVRVREQERVFAQTVVEAQVKEGKVELTTENVEGIELFLPEELIKEDRVGIVWNGHHLTRKLGPDRKVELRKGVIKKGGLHKTPEMYGPLKAVFARPFVVVYGTKGSGQETEVLLSQARYIAFMFWRMANGFTRVMADREVNERILKEYNIVLIGAPRRNSLAAKVMQKGLLPVRMEGNGVVVDGQRIEGGRALEVIYPNPLNPKRFVAVFAGTTAEAEKISLNFLPLSPYNGTPDFIIFTEEVKRSGWGGVIGAGFFGKDWTLANRDYYLRR